MNSFYIEFFELALDLKTLNKEQLTKKLLKLNNPNYYNKFIYKNPIERYGYTGKTINPVLLAISNMIKIIKTDSKDMLNQLQREYSWAFHNYSLYKNVDL